MNTLPNRLLSLLRDPLDHSPLELREGGLVSAANGRRYPIVDGIPALLDEADVGPQNVRLRDMYRWMSGGFDVVDRIGNVVSLGFITKARRQLAAELDLMPGERCLYTSIGTGLDLPFLAERVALDRMELVGLDLSREMLRQCQRKLARWPGPVLVQANAERLPFAAGAFDAVFHLGGINLFDRPALAAQEMARVARPGGRVLIADETAAVVRSQYQGWNPFTRKACRGISTDFDPRDWVPAGVEAVHYEETFKGKGYLLKFQVSGAR
ncbi:MAG TPA: methyltransferase domain-containing protein [Opitutaceae bacterium]|nr:methyltransferase domain-containing protein [Opitutaceae bacterium]